MRFFRIFGLLLLALLLIPFLAVQLFGGPLARRVVRAVNANLRTEITVGSYDLSWLRSFPSLSVNLADVTVAGSDGSRFLAAGELGFRLGFGSLWGPVDVGGVVVRDGELLILVDQDGNGNYNLTGGGPVTDEGGEGGDAGATEFRITAATLDNILLTYRDAQLQTDAVAHVSQATLTGDFGSDRYQLHADGQLSVRYLDQAGSRYAENLALELGTETTVDNATGTYSLSPLSLTAGDLELTVRGDLRPTPDGLSTNLNLASRSGSLEDILRLVPPTVLPGLHELETRGELDLSANVIGDWTDHGYPRIDGALSFTDGRVGSPRTNVGVRDLTLRATFAYLDHARGRGVQTFSVEELTGRFRNQPFSAELHLEDLHDPFVEFLADGRLPLGVLPAFLPEGTLRDGDGFVTVDKLRLRGRYADMIRPRRMGQVSAGGRLRLDDAELELADRTVRFPSGTLTLLDNRLELADLTFEAPGTELHFTGTATNLIPVLFADSLNTQDAKLEFNGTLTGKSLDIDELLALAGPSDEEIEAAAATGTSDSLQRRGVEERARLTDLLDGRFEGRIDRWNWDRMEGRDFRGQLVFRPRELTVVGLTEAMDGSFGLDADVFFTAAAPRATARLRARGVDVRQFFYQAEEFDQDVLVSDNLRGTMDGQLLLDLYYDETGEIDYDRLRVRAGLAITDGELLDFAMLENFAFALKAGDLDRVRFTRLENYFEIEEQTIYIPAMFIQSSAMNLTLSGSHTFAQYLDYYVKVNAGQVLANKISRHDRRLEILPARRNGFFNLYYTVRGPLETFAVESDKRAVKDDFRRSEYRRERVRRALEEAFREPIRLLEDEATTEDLAGD